MLKEGYLPRERLLWIRTSCSRCLSSLVPGTRLRRRGCDRNSWWPYFVRSKYILATEECLDILSRFLYSSNVRRSVLDLVR